MVYRTEVHFIRQHTRLFDYCDDTCFKSKNLYNHANYMIRQQFFYLETFLLRWEGGRPLLQVKHTTRTRRCRADRAADLVELKQLAFVLCGDAGMEADPSKFLGMRSPRSTRRRTGGHGPSYTTPAM